MFPESSINTSPETEATTTVEVDLDAEVEASNPDADFNERTAPPVGGLVYPIRWALDEKGIIPQLDKNQSPYLAVYLKGKLGVDGVYAGFPVNCYINSIVFGTKGTSELHHFLSAMGESAPQRIKLGALKEKIEELLANEPTGLALCDWRASYQLGVNPKNGKPAYKNLKEGMRNFPKAKNQETGETEYQFILENPTDGSPVIARFEVVKHVSQTEVNKEKLQMAG